MRLKKDLKRDLKRTLKKTLRDLKRTLKRDLKPALGEYNVPPFRLPKSAQPEMKMFHYIRSFHLSVAQ
jgi:hypothetical protein